MKQPAFQFYPGDWRKDPNLSRVSLSAKGAMIEIMCLAFECENRGILKTGGKAWSINEIAMAIGGDLEKNKSAIQELLDKKVLKKDRKGAIFSQRMCKDEKLRKVRREAGFKGGNPLLLNQNASKSLKNGKQNTTPSSSSSTSIINKENKKEKIEDFLWTSVKKNFLEDGPWQYKFVTEKKVTLEQLEKLQKEFIAELELREDLKDLKELKNHFTNYFNKKQAKQIRAPEKESAPLRTADYYLK